MKDQAESTPAEKVTRDVDSQVSEANSTESANEKMSREADESARSSSRSAGDNIQTQCEKQQNDTSFSMNGLKAYLGKLSDVTTSIVLDRTGNPGNSKWEDRIDAARRHRVAECMRDKQK